MLGGHSYSAEFVDMNSLGHGLEASRKYEVDVGSPF